MRWGERRERSDELRRRALCERTRYKLRVASFEGPREIALRWLAGDHVALKDLAVYQSELRKALAIQDAVDAETSGWRDVVIVVWITGILAYLGWLVYQGWSALG